MAGNDIFFGEKALAFLTNLLQQHHLALVFPFCGPVLSLLSQSYLHFSYCSECVPLDTVRVSSTPKHIRIPSIKHFKLHQLPRESDPLHLKHV